MSDPAVAVQRQQVRQQGLIAGLITLPFRLFGVLCGSLLLCIVIECIGMHFFWPEQGWRHAQGMLNYELSQVSEHFTQRAGAGAGAQRAARRVGLPRTVRENGPAGLDTRRAAQSRAGAPARRRTSATTSVRSTCMWRAT
jgi:hypothetical protein